MQFEHEHIERLGRGTRPHIVKYLYRKLRKYGDFLFPDEEMRLSMTEQELMGTLKAESIGGQVFLTGARIVGFALRTKTRTTVGKEWRILMIHVDETLTETTTNFDRVLGHIGKVLIEEAWANNASLIRFEDGTKKSQALLIDQAVRGTLPIRLQVKFHPGGDMSRLEISKPPAV